MNLNNQPLVKGSVAIVIIAAIIGVLSVLAGGFNLIESKLFAICMSLIFYGITGVISFASADRHRNNALSTSGVFSSVVAFVLVFIIVLAEVSDESILKLAFTFFIAAIALAHINLLHYFNLQNKYALYARIAGTTAISVFSLLIIIQIFSPMPSLYSFSGYQSVYKIIIAALIIDLSSTLLVPLCNRLVVEKEVEFTLTDVHEETNDQQITP